MLDLVLLLIIVFLFVMSLEKKHSDTKDERVTVISGTNSCFTNSKDISYIREIQHVCGDYTQSDVFDKSEWVDFFDYCDKEDKVC